MNRTRFYTLHGAVFLWAMRKAVYGICKQQRRRSACRSLISTFVVPCLDSILIVSISELSSLYIASVAAQAGCVPPSRKPRRQIFSWRGFFINAFRNVHSMPSALLIYQQTYPKIQPIDTALTVSNYIGYRRLGKAKFLAWLGRMELERLQLWKFWRESWNPTWDTLM